MSSSERDDAEVVSSTTSESDVDWTEAKHYPVFRDLLSSKARFIVPMLVLSLGFYLGVTLLAGLAPGFTSQRLIGPLSIGYLLVFLAYIVTWVVALVYVRVANRDFDSKAADAISELEERQAQKEQDA